MSNPLGTFIKKKLLRKDQNLISLDEPYDVMRRLLAGRAVTGVLDAGASNGHISQRLLEKFPASHVYAFEPQPMYKEPLERLARQNSRFHAQFAALGDHEGTAELHVTRSAGNTSLLQPMKNFSRIDPVGADVLQTLSVPLVTIDRWAADNAIPAVDVMKFDIQGYELAALRGAVNTLKTSTLAIYTEIWFNSVYENGAVFGQIDLFLRQQGFLLYDLYKPRYNRNKWLQWGNALFVHAARLGM